MFSFHLPPKGCFCLWYNMCQGEKRNWFTEFCITCNFEGRYPVCGLEEMALKPSPLYPVKPSSLVRPLKPNTDERQAAPRGEVWGICIAWTWALNTQTGHHLSWKATVILLARVPQSYSPYSCKLVVEASSGVRVVLSFYRSCPGSRWRAVTGKAASALHCLNIEHPLSFLHIHY